METYMTQCLNTPIVQDNEYYKLACEYMALTELYDRTLTDERCEYDTTSAYLSTKYQKQMSLKYAVQLRKKICKENDIRWVEILTEIKKHSEYNSQRWIDEYYRLQKGE